MPIHRTLISTLLFIHIYKGIFFCPHWLILSLFSPQPGIRRALKTWTWIQCVCAFSASSSGRTAGKTISARWCRSPFMTRVRHNQTNTPKSLDRSQPSVPKIRQRTSLFSRFVMHVFFNSRGNNYITAEDHPFEPVWRSLHWQDGGLHVVWQSAER